VAGVDHYLVYCYTEEGLTINEGTVGGNIPQANSSQIVNSTTIDWTEGSNKGVTPNPGLVNGTTYYFFVVSVNADGEENSSFFYSATPSTTPPPFAPVLTAATAGNAQITIAWDSVTASPAVTSYNIYIGTAKGVTKSTGAVTSITNIAPPLEATAPSLKNETTYYIVVTAVNSNGESAESNEMSATPL
jgi:cellulose 1,4-beta-cellobiosidase